MKVSILEALLYAQPLAVFVVFSVCQILSRVKSSGRHLHEDISRSKLRLLSWILQALIILTLLAIVVSGIFSLTNTTLSFEASKTLQTYLASRLSLFLYFTAGILPDIDQPFSPASSNFYSWLIAALIQLAILWVPPGPVLKALNLPSHSHWTLIIACEVVFLVLLVADASIFILEHCIKYARSDIAYDPLNTSTQQPQYGTLDIQPATPGRKQKPNDAQSTGWLDYFAGFQALFPYFWPSDSRAQQAITLLCFVLMIAQRVINVLVPYQLGVLVTKLGYGHVPYRELLVYCLFRGLQGQQGVIGSLRAMLWIPISQSLFQRLSYATYEHVMILSLDFHLSKKIGEVMSALSKGSALNTFLDGFAFQLFPMFFDIGVAAVYLLIKFSVFYSIVTVSVLWTYVFATIYMARWRGRQRRAMTLRDREMDAMKTDTIIAYETVHHNDALPFELSRLTDYIKAFQKAEFSVLFSLNTLNALQNFIFIIGILLVTVLSANQIANGEADVASFVSIITYFAQLQAPLAFFGSFYTMVQNNMVDAERMLDLFQKIPDIRDSDKSYPLTHARGEIEFKDVGFSYDQRKSILGSISFKASPGTTTALVGESGAGKSTCLRLLFRFYDVTAGSVTVDGHDIRDLTLNSLREIIGIVPQETFLFNDTLIYNLRYARPDASYDQVVTACQYASIHDKILNFPDGYNTMVGERGFKLSTGEKQRIAIARAILKDPVIMLFDEATASLDSHTERLIQEAFQQVRHGRTTITIAHRLSTITDADQILVMHEGNIVERGTHDSLLAKDGRYAAMWRKQMREEEQSDSIVKSS